LQNFIFILIIRNKSIYDKKSKDGLVFNAKIWHCDDDGDDDDDGKDERLWEGDDEDEEKCHKWRRHETSSTLKHLVCDGFTLFHVN